MDETLVQPNSSFVDDGNFVFDGDVVLTDASGRTRIRLDHERGNIFVYNEDGDLVFQWQMPESHLRFGGRNQDGDLLMFPAGADIANNGEATIQIDANSGNIFAGGAGADGDLILRSDTRQNRIRLDAGGGNAWLGGNGADGDIALFASSGDNQSVEQATIYLNGGNIIAGGQGTDGDLILRGEGGQNRVRLDAGAGNAWLGGNGVDGDIALFAAEGDNVSVDQASMLLSDGNIFAGGQGRDGDLILRGEDGQNRVRVDAGEGNLWLGGNGVDGDVVLFRANDNNVTTEQASIHLDGNSGNIFAGGQGVDGDLVLRGEAGQNRIRLNASQGNVWLGGNGADGDLALFAAGGDNQSIDQATIRLNGDSGEILFQNGDCAEDFEVDVNELSTAEPGTVMVIGNDARLQVSGQAYDQRVAGIVAGANDNRPGIVLGRKEGETGKLPIALMGRVFCKVDADQGAVHVGDLLTTSAVAGYAMKVADPLRAFGAVIGKALQPLQSGQGLVPVLVALQ
ncbi:MAG: hypothetical protein AAF639_45625 [Chloroflexota bacterium]